MRIKPIKVCGIIILMLHLSEGMGLYRSKLAKRIANLKVTGGYNAVRGQYQWQAMLLIKKKTQSDGKLTLCGGTLISTKWVLTAAHCVEDHLKMRVYFGVWNVTNANEVGRITRMQKKVIPHPCYDVYKKSRDGSFSGYNMAMIELDSHVFRFQASCIDQSGSHDWKKLANLNTLGGCIATGYGITVSGQRAVILQKAQFSTVSREACNVYGSEYQDNNVVCASDKTVWGRDTCKGDMGGPLVCPTSRSGCNGYYIAGVTLAGSTDCGEQGRPGIYAAVHPNIQWIKSVMKNLPTVSNKNAQLCNKVSPKGNFRSGRPHQAPELRTSETQILDLK